jgi:hypothetical protein
MKTTRAWAEKNERKFAQAILVHCVEVEEVDLSEGKKTLREDGILGLSGVERSSKCVIVLL